MEYVIKQDGYSIAGFNPNIGQGIVQYAHDKGSTKVFYSMESARAFIEKYADCGWGLCSKSAEIVETTKRKDK